MTDLIDKLLQYKARAWICLVIIYISVIFSIWWLWGVLLIVWGIQDLVIEKAWLGEMVPYEENPVLYHLIVISWLTLGFYLVFDRLF